MNLQEFTEANLPKGWERKLCSSGRAFFEEHRGLEMAEVFARVRANLFLGRHLRLVALWIFGDRAREVMDRAQERALRRPWTWETTSAWGAEFLQDLNGECIHLLGSRL